MLKLFLLTTLALVAFAGNSVLNRLALLDGSTDAASFTAIRLLSGALVLLLIASVRTGPAQVLKHGSWLSAAMLFIYAAAFSYAYQWLETGIGALILFGFVQLSMIAIGILTGQRPKKLELLGMAVAMAGLGYLLAPDKWQPDPFGFLLMAAAGTAWGVYTLLGKGIKQPLNDTAMNFVRAAPLVVILMLFSWCHMQVSDNGVVLALLSGMLTSGVGYAIWYAALPHLPVLLAASLQLLVPLLATAGGVVFSGEQLSVKLMLSALLILGGIALVVMARSKPTPTS